MSKMSMTVIVSLVLSGCGLNIRDNLDYISFNLLGKTYLKSRKSINTKEAHFNSDELLGKEVIITGNVESIGKFYTHLLVKDDTGKILVVLTQIESAEKDLDLKKSDNKKVKVLGTIERGKRGLPFLMAKAIRVETPEKKY
ncbi:MAG: hypothetical protein HQK54_12025 [Oligoflexales bacterium]|nr:hypothetical protein [Oligoflexales bacterium]